MELHFTPDYLGDLVEILFVLERQNHGTDARTMRRKDFFANAADREDVAAKGNFAGHGEFRRHGNVFEQAENGRENGGTGRGTVLRNRPLREMNMDIPCLVKVLFNAQLLAAAAVRLS